jgi:hypothetical protein
MFFGVVAEGGGPKCTQDSFSKHLQDLVLKGYTTLFRQDNGRMVQVLGTGVDTGR